MNECFSGIYCEISPDVANVVKMHISCSANGTDVTSHTEGGIEYNANVTTIDEGILVLFGKWKKCCEAGTQLWLPAKSQEHDISVLGV